MRAQQAIAIQRFRAEGLALLIWVVVGLLVIANAGAFVVDRQTDSSYLPLVLPWTLLVVIGVYWYFWGRAWINAWHQRFCEATVQYPIRHTLGANGLRVRNRSAEQTLGWGSLERIVETREFVIYYRGDYAYYMPKRVVDAGRLAELRTLIRAHARGAVQLES